MDKWKPEQLKAMTLGGNAKASAFFKSHGWEGNSDFEAKYHSRAAKMYHKQLMKLVSGNKSHDDDIHDVDDATSTSKETAVSSTEKVTTPVATTTTSASTADSVIEPKLVKGSAATQSGSGLLVTPATMTESKEPILTMKPKTTTTTSAGLGARRIGATSAPTAKSGMGAKRLGASKAVDASLSNDLDIDIASVTISANKQTLAENANKVGLSDEDGPSKYSDNNASRYQTSYSSSSTSSKSNDVQQTKSSSGGGFSITGGGRNASTNSSSSSSVSATAAQDRFKNAKGISSDQFFGNNEEDQNQKEATLNKFQGARAISSDAYFGRAQPNEQSGSSSLDGGSAADFFAEIGTKVAEDLKNVAQKARSALQNR